MTQEQIENWKKKIDSKEIMMIFRIGRQERSGDTVSIGDILPKIIDQLDLKDDLSIGYIQRSWPDVAGNLSSNSRPEKIEGGILYISSNHSIISNELSMMKTALIARFNEKFHAGIKDMRFIHGGKI